MLYLTLFFEFFKIGLFAIGGGLVTVPFLFDLTEHYSWFTASELADMIAVSESTPGPLGVNMATFAGFNAAGVSGAAVSTFGLVLPSVIIIVIIARLLTRFKDNPIVHSVLAGIRPAVIALICMAGWEIVKISMQNWIDGVMFVVFFAAFHKFKKSPILYIILGAIVGIILKL